MLKVIHGRTRGWEHGMEHICQMLTRAWEHVTCTVLWQHVALRFSTMRIPLVVCVFLPFNHAWALYM